MIAKTAAPGELLERIKRESAFWPGAYGETLSLSVGYASHRDHPDADVHGLEVLADQRMYREKARYYRIPGVDRRRFLQDEGE